MQKITFTTAQSDEDLQQILHLQKQNYKDNISALEASEQGFVSIEHDLELLKAMNADYPHIIAKAEEQVVAYALVMLRKFGDAIPILYPMFERIDCLDWEGKSMKESKYFIMGQVCIAKAYRGQGIFAKLYKNMKQQMQADFDYLVTEVASRNKRSLRAHEKAGFQLMLNYDVDEEEWNIILLPLK